MSKKNILKTLIITIISISGMLLLSLILYGIYYLLMTIAFFYAPPPILLEKKEIDKRYTIEFYYIPGHTTITDGIQVRKVDNETKKDYLLENYDWYNYLEKYSLNGDSLTIILKDTNCHLRKEIMDTFKISIQDVDMSKYYSGVLSEKIKIDSLNEIIFTYFPGNAYRNASINIEQTNNKLLIKKFPKKHKRYNYMDDLTIKGDSLTVILSDTNYRNDRKIVDTFNLNIRDFESKLIMAK